MMAWAYVNWVLVRSLFKGIFSDLSFWIATFAYIAPEHNWFFWLYFVLLYLKADLTLIMHLDSSVIQKKKKNLDCRLEKSRKQSQSSVVKPVFLKQSHEGRDGNEVGWGWSIGSSPSPLVIFCFTLFPPRLAWLEKLLCFILILWGLCRASFILQNFTSC